MQFKKVLIAAIAGAATAQNVSLCDKYTMALTGGNNATLQYTVLTLLVNTVVIGNFSALGVKNAVPGILAPGVVNGKNVSLLKYFDGSLLSSNRGGKPTSVNFLDDGGATPLSLGKAANGTSSNQYMLLTHLYEYFGTLLGCSQIGSMGFPAYAGVVPMYTVHKFMALSHEEITYFITQVGLAATSFGVTAEDAMSVGSTLDGAFNYACIPASAIVTTDPVLNTMCDGTDCPLAPNANCTAYDTTNTNGTEAEPSTASMASGTATGTGSATGTGTATGTGAATSSTSSTGSSAGTIAVSGAAGFAALFMAAFAL